MFRYFKILIIQIGILAPAISMHSQDIKSSQNDRIGNMTLGEYLGIDNIDDVTKIIIYAFRQEFQSPFTGNREHDNFYNLLRGEKFDLSEFPHRVFTESSEIKLLTDEILAFPYDGDCIYENPELPGHYGLLIKKEYLYINKTIKRTIIGLIMIFVKDRVPILLWQYFDHLSYKGKEFINNHYSVQDTASVYNRMFLEIENSKPRSMIIF